MSLDQDSLKGNTKSLVSLSSDDDSVDSPILGGGSSAVHSNVAKPIILNNSLSNEESIPLMAPPVLHEQSTPDSDSVAPSDEAKPSVYVDSMVLES